MSNCNGFKIVLHQFDVTRTVHHIWRHNCIALCSLLCNPETYFILGSDECLLYASEGGSFILSIVTYTLSSSPLKTLQSCIYDLMIRCHCIITTLDAHYWIMYWYNLWPMLHHYLCCAVLCCAVCVCLVVLSCIFSGIFLVDVRGITQGVGVLSLENLLKSGGEFPEVQVCRCSRTKFCLTKQFLSSRKFPDL